MTMVATLVILQIEIDEIVATLGVNRPIDGASLEELDAWVGWWRPSFETARGLPPDRVAYLKSGGWWPPVSSEQIARVPPRIVVRSLRPNLFNPRRSEQDS